MVVSILILQLWTGSGSARSIDNTITAQDGTETGEAFKFSPDLAWIKIRSQAYDHNLMDTIRGVDKQVRSNRTIAEVTNATLITSFDSNGYSLGTGSDVNKSGDTFVGWNWRGSDSTAVSNTDGSITSTVSANTTAGFSVGDLYW